MEIIRDIKKFNSLPSSVLTIGSYDGVHLGHIGLLKSLVSYSKKNKLPSVLVTFDPHPKAVLSKNKIELISSFKSKIRTIKQIGIDYIYVINFTIEFSKISAEDFLSLTIIPNFKPKKIYTGIDHQFGKNRTGDASYLLQYFRNRNISVEIIKSIMNNGDKVSSTRIRNLINLGEVKNANSLLGSNFTLEGTVVKGSGRGSSLGFPTANINPIENNQLLPKNGVYLIQGMIDGQITFGMCNLGLRPTFKENDFVIEVHFFHNSLINIYGLILEIEFLDRIRDEIKFPSSKKLIEQLNLDKETCLKLKSINK